MRVWQDVRQALGLNGLYTVMLTKKAVQTGIPGLSGLPRGFLSSRLVVANGASSMGPWRGCAGGLSRLPSSTMPRLHEEPM